MSHDGLWGPTFDQFAKAHADELAPYLPEPAEPRDLHIIDPDPASTPGIPFDPALAQALLAAAKHATTGIAADQHAQLHPPSRVPAWARGRTAKVAAWTCIMPTLVTGMANATAHYYSPLWAGLGAGVLFAASVIGAVYGLNRKWNDGFTGGLTVLSVGSLSFWASAAAGGWMEVVSWLLAAGGSFGVKLWWDRKREGELADLDLKKAKVEGQRITNQGLALRNVGYELDNGYKYARLSLAAAQAQPAVEPAFPAGLEGQLQRAVYGVTGKILPISPAVRTGTGWEMSVALGEGVTKRAIEGKADAIAEAMGLEAAPTVTYGTTHDYVTVAYREPGELPLVVGYSPDLVPPAWDAPIRLGVDAYGDPVVQKFGIHSIIAGSTGGGKSNCINMLVVQLAGREGVEIVGIDMKPGMPEIRPLTPLLTELAGTLDDAHRVLDDAIDEMNRRGPYLAARGAKKWDPTVHDGPVRYIVMDEYGELIRAENRHVGTLKGDAKNSYVTIKSKVETLAALARFVGIFLVMGSQTPDSTLFGDNTAAKANFPIRVVFRLEQQYYQFALPPTSAWVNAMTSKHPGRFIVYSPDHDEPAVHQSYRLADSDSDAEIGLDPQQLEREITRIAALRESWGYGRAVAPDLFVHAADDTPEDRVRAYRAVNPDASQVAISKALGISRSTLQDILKRI